MLVAAHTLVSVQRLMDVIGLVETDHRLQLVFSKAPAPLGDGVSEYLDFIGALRIPWAQAVHERFDLALAAAYAAIDEIHAPVLVRRTVPGGANAPAARARFTAWTPGA